MLGGSEPNPKHSAPKTKIQELRTQNSELPPLRLSSQPGGGNFSVTLAYLRVRVKMQSVFKTPPADRSAVFGGRVTASNGAMSEEEPMRRSLLVCVMVVLVAVPLAAGEGKKCTHSTQECLNYMVSNMKDRGWVGIEYDEETMTVTRVMPESPAEAAGFKAGDVMTAVNGIAFGEENSAKLKELEWKPGATMAYTLDRHGSTKTVKVTLAPIPENVLAQWVGSHMIEGHTEIKVASLD